MTDPSKPDARRPPHRSAGSSSDSSPDLCAVCLEPCSGTDTQTCTTLPCSHAFHAVCLLPHFRRTPTCPCCRDDAREDATCRDPECAEHFGLPLDEQLYRLHSDLLEQFLDLADRADRAEAEVTDPAHSRCRHRVVRERLRTAPFPPSLSVGRYLRCNLRLAAAWKRALRQRARAENRMSHLRRTLRLLRKVRRSYLHQTTLRDLDAPLAGRLPTRMRTRPEPGYTPLP